MPLRRLLHRLRRPSPRRAARDRVYQAEERYRTLVEQLPLVIYVDALTDTATSMYMSPQVERLLGYPVSDWLDDPEFFARLLHPDDRERILALVDHCNRTADLFKAEYRLISRDGRVVWLKDESQVLLDAAGNPSFTQGYLLDITDRRIAEDALRASEERTRSIIDAALDCVVTVDQQGRIIEFNRAAEATFGHRFADIKGRLMAELLVPAQLRDAHGHGFATAVARGALAAPGQRAELTALRADGVEFPVELTVARVDLACGAVFTAYLRDITAQREAEAGRDRAEATLRHQALHDALTGLPNRTLFRERVKDALEQARQAGTSVGVALMDLDRFKEINDTLGHHTGDALLRNLAERLQGALGETDTVARLGGDEFAFLILDADAASAVELAARIESVLGEPFSLQRLSLEVESSIGFAIFPEHGDSVDLLLQRADVAMYAAKRAATQVAFYDPAVDEHTPARLTLVADLRRAIEEHELVLHYQPQIELSTGKVTGVEALVRWEHPIHGLRPPDEFIPAAERSGLIHALTRFVIEQALRQQQLWARDGIRLVVSVNVSMRNLVDGAFPADVAALIGVRDAGGSLALEITEHSFLADGFRARSVLEALSAMGVDVAIDDFGTGFSSLAALRRLPLSAIKIDRSFVRSMTSDRDDAVIVRSTIDLARNLGLRVIAEGVETVGVYNALVALGCDSAQGYYMSRPVPAHELTAWLEVRDAA